MRGALKARRERFEADRDLALMTAYFSGQLAQVDWVKAKIGSFAEWRDSLVTPPRRLKNSEIISRFDAMARRGLVTAH